MSNPNPYRVEQLFTMAEEGDVEVTPVSLNTYSTGSIQIISLTGSEGTFEGDILIQQSNDGVNWVSLGTTVTVADIYAAGGSYFNDITTGASLVRLFATTITADEDQNFKVIWNLKK